MGSVWKAPSHATPFHSPQPRPTLSSQPLWWGYSPGTPGTDWSLETPNMTARLLVRTEVKKRGGKGKKKKGREQLCSWLHLPVSVISIHSECKQRHERGKHGQSGGGKKTGGGRGGGRKQSASKNILAGCVRYKSPAHLLVSLPDKNTHSQATQIWLSHTSSQRSLCESCDKLLTHFNINLLDNSCKQSCCFSED